ncbi:MAG: ABC transporter permease [Cytophagales bacterium]|nr:ABC transporter permease [Cytophagales bacterium]
MKNSPPKLAQRFFSWYCRNRLHDSILGDLDEQFCQNLDKYGVQKARLYYWLGVLQFFNRFTLKRENQSTSHHSNTIPMLKNNFISSLRFLSRNKRFTAINVFGLTIGFTSILLIMLFVNHQQSFDQFHANKDQVYRVNFAFQDNAGNVTKLVNSPPALATGVWGKFPELQKISRMRYAMNSLLANGDRRFYEDHGYYADSLFLETLQFEMSAGDPGTALDNPNSIVITESLASKYFNRTDPIGRTLMFNNTTPLKVTGILADLPDNSHLDFNFLISFSTYTIPEGYASDLSSWSWLGFLTYVELSAQSDPEVFEEKLVQHFKDLNPDNPNPMLPEIQSLSDIYLGSVGMADDLASHIRSGNQFTVNALSTIAVLILIIAGFNFANLSYALSINRSKSTGIRKVLGANRRNIIAQLLTESLLLTTLCLAFSIGLTIYLFPMVSSWLDWEITPGPGEFWSVSALMIAAGMVTGLLAGIYPALALAGFDVIKSLRGAFKGGANKPWQLKNVLILLQFSISIGFITATIIITKQLNYLSSADMGYETENVVAIKMLPEDLSHHYEIFRERLLQQSTVAHVSRSERVVGDPWPWSVALPVNEDPENSKRVFFNLADYDYFKTMGIPLSEGRSFSEAHVNDPTRSMIINQKAADYLNLQDPVGKQVHFFELEGPRTIIGVVEDFNYTSLHDEIGPAVVIMPFIDMEFMYVRFESGNLQEQVAFMEGTWQQVAPGMPLDWRFLDEKLDRLYHSEEKLSEMIQVFAVLAILLACLGLYGIVAFMINTRIKEFGVRKVLGASIRSLYILFVKKYILQTVLALLIILPIVHHLLTDWLTGFAYHIQIHWTIYPAAALVMVLMILITISFRTLNAARANPTELLRTE